MGKWIGKILGGDGSTTAADNMEFVVDESGNVTVANNGNTNNGASMRSVRRRADRMISLWNDNSCFNLEKIIGPAYL